MKTLPTILLALVLSTLPLLAQWPQFRGPDGTGNSSRADLPLTWARRQERPLEDGRPRPRLVVTGHPGLPDLDDDRDRGWPRALRRGARSRLGQDPVRPEALPGGDAAVRAPVQHVCVADAGHRAGPRLRDVRVAGNRRDRHQDGEGPLGAARLRVQSFSRRRLVAGPVRRPAAHALRRQRPSVRRRARQAHREDRVADAPVDRLPGSESRRQAEGRR